jgi:hypothetical protein
MFTQKKHKKTMGCPCSCLFVEEKPYRPRARKPPIQRLVASKQGSSGRTANPRYTTAWDQGIQRPVAAARKGRSPRTTQPRSTLVEDQSKIRHVIQRPNTAFHQRRTGGTTYPRPTASEDQRKIQPKIQSQIQPGSLTFVEHSPSDNSFDSGYPESSFISLTSLSSGTLTSSSYPSAQSSSHNLSPPPPTPTPFSSPAPASPSPPRSTRSPSSLYSPQSLPQRPNSSSSSLIVETGWRELRPKDTSPPPPSPPPPSSSQGSLSSAASGDSLSSLFLRSKKRRKWRRLEINELCL